MSSSGEEDEPTCRICFGGEEDGELIEPCKCAGSMALIHRSCLDAVRVSGFDPSSLVKCGLCKENYVLEGTGGGPRQELMYTVGRYLGLRFLALFAAAGVLGFTPRLVPGAAQELQVARNPVLNHFSVGGVATLILTGGYAVVAFVGPLNLANLSRGRWGSRRNRDENLQATLALLLVVGLCYLLYHLATSTYRLMRTGVPVALDSVRAANKRERERLAAKYPVVDRRTGAAPRRRAPQPPRAVRRWWLFGLLGSAAAQSTIPRRPSTGIPKRFAQNLTLYHVNELSEGVVPRNMDVADLGGEIFFEMRALILPIECAAGPGGLSGGGWPGDCDNLELYGTNLVVSKLVVEVDSRWGQYGLCNECGPDGVDAFSKLPCTPGSYFCSCVKAPLRIQECDAPDTLKVGRNNLTQSFGRWAAGTCTWDQYIARPWTCWAMSVVQKTGGAWYSTFAASEGSAWRVVEVAKVVTKACSDASLYKAIEAGDSVKCFDACGAPRNTSSVCWIGCFYRTILGAEGMLPTGAGRPGGMSYDALAQAWEAPFASSDPSRGGCPAVAVPDMTGTRPGVVSVSRRRRRRLASRGW